ncbi:MAG: hypothetical protein CAPSK01_002929 [Candidatus Accumulibacter vicinus]|uniref:Uncharacterized protein n=1 Tax=Candidatus Accumulibacter vicinus TaxID=2954382 RepID=A0A084XYE4_9PROT|nr:MAG: hypothetical protein CAPSK01_002929 [Candidatus Accumulibacter vicinus]
MTTHIPAVLMVFKLIPEDNHSIKMGYYNINKISRQLLYSDSARSGMRGNLAQSPAIGRHSHRR